MAKINNAAVSATKAANLTKVHQYALAKRPPYITRTFRPHVFQPLDNF